MRNRKDQNGNAKSIGVIVTDKKIRLLLNTEEFQMVIHLKNGNPIVAMVLMTLCTFRRDSALIAAFTEITMTFRTEESASQFVQDIRPLGCTQSFSEATKVVVAPDYASSENAARAIYHAIDSYKDYLVSIDQFELSPYLEETDNLIKDIEQYIKDYFGSDAIA